MKIVKKALLSLCFLNAICVLVFAQNYPIKFKHISYQQGLSQSPIACLFQDKKGLVWIGNREGLLRFDGYEFRTYSHKNNQKNSISHNTIRTITEDSQGKIWVGTVNGLNIYNPVNDTFRYIDVTRSKTVAGLYVQDNENIWVASYDGLKRLNINGQQIPLGNVGAKVKTGVARCLKYDSKGILWIGFSNGLACINPKLKKEVQLPPAIQNNHLLMKSSLSSIAEDKQGDLWFGTEDNGLFWYHKEAATLHNFRQSLFNTGLLSDVIKDILVYDLENIWLGTRFGLSIYNKKTQKFVNYTHDVSDFNSLSNSSVWCFLREKAGNIWLGTYAGGINLYSPSLNNFENIGEKIGGNIGFNQPVVNAILEEKGGALWVATDGGGLNYLDRINNRSKFYPLFDTNNSRVSHIVKALAKGSNGKLYLGTLQGLGIFNNVDASIQYLPLAETEPLERRRVNAILADDSGIWVAMHHAGLYHIDQKNGITVFQTESKNINSISTNNLRSLLADENKGIWIGAGNGLNYLNKTTGKITRYGDFDDQAVISMLIDKKRRFWLGTDRGLILFDSKTGKRDILYEADGLMSDMIEAIVEDNLGKIWISTSKGITSIDFKEGVDKWNRKNIIVNNYTSNDGLSSNQFLPGAVLKTKNGELLFGGVNGLTAFYPEKIIKNTYRPNIVFTDFYIHNRLITNTIENSPLEFSINDTRKLTLNYSDNSISFKVAALNFLNANNNQYAYRLDGLDKENEWHYGGNQRIINYTELQPGNYVFKIKASNNDNVWNDLPRSIAIEILPPFWKTWWAYLLYLCIFSCLLYLFNHYSVKAQKLKHQLELESMLHTKDQELAQRKMSFFTNISHEIKTPITMILAPLEQLLGANLSKEKTRSHLRLMYQNGERLKKLINQLLDFRKFDNGSEDLLTSHSDMVKFIEEIILAFKGLADSKNITLQLDAQQPEIWGWFDEDKMEKVLFNVLSNAIKFTPNHIGKINVAITKILQNEEESIVISVEDNGCGISPEHIHHIFEEFKFYNENGLNKEGTGIGLAYAHHLVQMHQGNISVESRPATDETEGFTKFIVKLPQNYNHKLQHDLDQIEEMADHITMAEEAVGSYHKKREEVLKGLGKEKPLLLVVEDNTDLRTFTVQSFDRDFEVVEAVNGLAGLEKSQQLMPDIIVSDVMMPELDGISLCSRIKSDVRTSHIPVILLTARSATMFKLEGFETGADDYITKPFAVNLLHVRVWNLLYSRQQLRNKFKERIILEPENTVISSTDATLLKTLMGYIEKHIDNADLTIEDLCKEVSIGRGTLYKKIKALTSKTVNDFIRTVRLKRAAQLLEGKQHNVNEVAYMVGFADVNYFRRCFKEQFGLTPKEYSKQDQI